MNFGWVIAGKLAGCMGPVLSDEVLYLKRLGVGAIVRLERNTISGASAGLADMAEYVPNMHAPSIDQLDRILAFIDQQIEKDLAVAVSCQAGLGRTGTVLACYLVHAGSNAEEALERVRRLRPGSVESPPQQDFVYSYEARLKRRPDRI